MMEFRLCDLPIGREGILRNMFADGPFACRLRQFGFIEGTRIRCIGCSPMGSPILFMARGTAIALRREDCRVISVVTA